MHFKYLLPLAAASFVLSSAAALADVDTATAANDWNGFYLGAEGGAAFGYTHFNLPGDTHDALKRTTSDKTAFLGGGLLGYDFQDGNLVYGLEVDATSGAGTSSVTACNATDGCFVTTHDSFTTINHLKTNWSGRVRGRIGFVNTDGNLFYLSAGYSYADTKLSLVGLCYDPANPTVPMVYNFNRSKNLSGFNVGAGIERGFGDHFVARLEYVYEDFGDNTYAGSVEWNDRRIGSNNGTVRAAVSYRF